MKIFNKTTLAVLSTIALIAITGCRGTQKVSGSMSYYNFGSSHIATSASGAVTMRTWGSGPDKNSALLEAMKNAVADVIFTGVKGGSGYSCEPIVTEVNARERYAPYFDRFFADNGEFRKFVYETSNHDLSRIESKSNGRQNYGMTVTVDRTALRDQLLRDGIITR